MQIKAVHHIAIIASDYMQSLRFYTEILNLKIIGIHASRTRLTLLCRMVLMLWNSFLFLHHHNGLVTLKLAGSAILPLP